MRRCRKRANQSFNKRVIQTFHEKSALKVGRPEIFFPYWHFPIHINAGLADRFGLDQQGPSARNLKLMKLSELIGEIRFDPIGAGGWFAILGKVARLLESRLRPVEHFRPDLNAAGVGIKRPLGRRIQLFQEQDVLRYSVEGLGIGDLPRLSRIDLTQRRPGLRDHDRFSRRTVKIR